MVHFHPNACRPPAQLTRQRNTVLVVLLVLRAHRPRALLVGLLVGPCWLVCLLRVGCAGCVGCALGASASGASGWLAGWRAGWLACSALVFAGCAYSASASGASGAFTGWLVGGLGLKVFFQWNPSQAVTDKSTILQLQPVLPCDLQQRSCQSIGEKTKVSTTPRQSLQLCRNSAATRLPNAVSRLATSALHLHALHWQSLSRCFQVGHWPTWTCSSQAGLDRGSPACHV